MQRRIFVIGATGTVVQATVRALVRRGCEVMSFVRPALASASGCRPRTA